MREFKLELGVDMRVVVPAQFTSAMREAALAEDASVFLKQAQQAYPEDDDAFTLHILTNGLRKNVRAFLISLFSDAGIGCTLSPAKLAVIDRSVPKDVRPALTSEIAQVIPD